jgi:hypothetical protein
VEAKIIQITVLNGELVALCEDGTVWKTSLAPGGPWTKIR